MYRVEKRHTKASLRHSTINYSDTNTALHLTVLGGRIFESSKMIFLTNILKFKHLFPVTESVFTSTVKTRNGNHGKKPSPVQSHWSVQICSGMSV